MTHPADEFVERCTAWLHANSQALELAPLGFPRIEWQRDGLGNAWIRMETLKLANAEQNSLAEQTTRMLATARYYEAEARADHDDIVGTNLAAEVSTMAARGMAADERRIAHDTKALPVTLRLRRLRQLIVLLEAHDRVIGRRLYAIRDERQDLRVQLRAIDVAVEIGEL